MAPPFPSRFCLVVTATLCVLPSSFLGQLERPQPLPSAAANESLKRFLQEYVRLSHLEDDKATRYFHASVDLNGDGKKEVIVYLMGRWWCGSGGCPTLILEREADSYKVVTRTTVTRPPIKVLPTISNGWRSISVWVQGGGIRPGYEAELPFDGRTYPSNPSM